MKNLAVAFSALCVTFMGCSVTDLGDELLILRSSVATATLTNQSTSQVTFLARASWFNGCGRFARAEITRNASSFFITIYGMQPKDAVCTQAFILFPAPVTIQIPSGGTYTFKFWRTDSTSYDTTLTIK